MKLEPQVAQYKLEAVANKYQVCFKHPRVILPEPQVVCECKINWAFVAIELQNCYRFWCPKKLLLQVVLPAASTGGTCREACHRFQSCDLFWCPKWHVTLDEVIVPQVACHF